MKRYGYIVLSVVLLVILSLPERAGCALRSASVATLSPSWRHLLQMKELFLNITTVLPSGGYHVPPQVTKELEMMRLENHELKSQVELLKAELELKETAEKQSLQLVQMSETDAFSERRKAEIFRQLELYSHAITARVIFRESGAWQSSAWVNVGEETNARLKTRLIEKNSPVVLGTHVVGLVDYVGKRRSRIRFITDRALTPSVRIVRGNEKPLYLAKGETEGMRYPTWRSRGVVLKGVGFNYDFEDAEGAGKELRSGVIQVGDTVVTSGMDGVFPAGLKVGMVAKVYPLKEGGTSYEAEIVSPIRDFENFSFLTILPPLDE